MQWYDTNLSSKMMKCKPFINLPECKVCKPPVSIFIL